MEIMFYNEWQKDGFPLGPSFAVDAAGLHRRLCRRHTPRVKASARSSFSSSAQFAHSRYGAEDFFLRPPVGRRSRRHSRAEEDNKFRDLATPTLLHFGSAQARPFAIIDGLFKVLPALFGVALNFRSSHHGRGPLQLADEDLPPGGRRTLRRHRAQCQTALRGLQEALRDVVLKRHTKTATAAVRKDGSRLVLRLSCRKIIVRDCSLLL